MLPLRRAILFAVTLSLTGLPAETQGSAASEPEIKAAMIHNFTKFAEWNGPKADLKTAIVIGVHADDPVFEALENLVRERGGGRAVQLRRIEQPSGAEACHVLYLGRGAKKRVPDFVAAARKGVLTVGDGADFVKAGGMIGFIIADNKLRFEVNLTAATPAGITISSRLLRLATAVRQ